MSGPAFCSAERVDELALAVTVDERETGVCFVAADLRDQLDARVDVGEDREINRGDLVAKLFHRPIDIVLAHSRSSAGYDPNRRSCRVLARISCRVSRTSGSSGCPASTASKR